MKKDGPVDRSCCLEAARKEIVAEKKPGRQLSLSEKNTISHRGKAVEAMMDFLSAPLQPNCRP